MRVSLLHIRFSIIIPRYCLHSRCSLILRLPTPLDSNGTEICPASASPAGSCSSVPILGVGLSELIVGCSLELGCWTLGAFRSRLTFRVLSFSVLIPPLYQIQNRILKPTVGLTRYFYFRVFALTTPVSTNNDSPFMNYSKSDFLPGSKKLFL